MEGHILKRDPNIPGHLLHEKGWISGKILVFPNKWCWDNQQLFGKKENWSSTFFYQNQYIFILLVYTSFQYEIYPVNSGDFPEDGLGLGWARRKKLELFFILLYLIALLLFPCIISLLEIRDIFTNKIYVQNNTGKCNITRFTFFFFF